MSELICALLCEGEINDTWVPLAAQRFGLPPATMTDNSTGAREVYITQCFVDHATISRLPGGVDIEQGTQRVIFAHELTKAVLVKRLGIDESHVMALKPDRAPKALPIRWRCVMTERT